MMLASTESDGFALAMLLVLLSSFGIILMLGFCMFRNASRRNGDVDKLLEEIADEEKSATGRKIPAGEVKPELWEKDGDWWKGE